MDFQNKSLEDLKGYYEGGKNPLAYIPYAEALRRENLFTQALEICLSGLKQDSYSVTGRTLLAKIFFDMGRYDNTVLELKVALKIAPDAFGANLLLARTMAKQRNPNEALEILNKLDMIKPNDPELAILKEEIFRIMNYIDTQVNPSRVPTTPDTRTPQEKFVKKDSIDERLKEVLCRYSEIKKHKIESLEKYKELPESEDERILTDFYLSVNETLEQKKFGNLIKGFLDINNQTYAFYVFNSTLLTIVMNNSAKFGRIKKDIENIIYG